jgi:multiple sugar transport system permease protein
MSNTVLAIMMAFFLAPALWLVLTGVRNQVEVNSFPPVWWPHTLTLDGFRKLFTPGSAFTTGGAVPFVKYLTNSAIVSVSATATAVTLGTFAAFGFTRWRTRTSDALLIAMVLSRAIPGVALSIPLAVLFGDLHLTDTRWELFVSYTAVNIPLSVFLMDGFFRVIPEELFEAARVDGAGLWRTFASVALPLVRPGIAASAMLAFLSSWNEFQIASVLEKSVRSITLPKGLFDFTNLFQVDWQAMSAMAALMIVPPAIFVVFAQRHLIRGLILGAGR